MNCGRNRKHNADAEKAKPPAWCCAGGERRKDVEQEQIMNDSRINVNDIVQLYPAELRLAKMALAVALDDAVKALQAVSVAQERVRRAEKRMEECHEGA